MKGAGRDAPLVVMKGEWLIREPASKGAGACNKWRTETHKWASGPRGLSFSLDETSDFAVMVSADSLLREVASLPPTVLLDQESKQHRAQLNQQPKNI